mgnify:CR=1 FL=1
MTATGLRQAIDVATAALAQAGIDSARADAELLAAHAAGTERGRLAVLAAPDAEFFGRYDELITARTRRIPLQHITGTAAFGPLTLHVGPGVFIPRPETEALLEWALAQSLPADPLIVDLCTGSGALAISSTPNQDNPLMGKSIAGCDGTPILGLDVWEHAYYIDYRNLRPKFVETFLDKLANWKFAEANFA